MTPPLDFRTQLQTVPLRNRKVIASPAKNDPDVLIAEIQLKYTGILGVLANLVRARKKCRYELAGVAKELYERLDGNSTVEALVVAFAEEEKLTFLESRALLTQYLSILMKRGLIVILQDGQPS